MALSEVIARRVAVVWYTQGYCACVQLSTIGNHRNSENLPGSFRFPWFLQFAVFHPLNRNKTTKRGVTPCSSVL